MDDEHRYDDIIDLPPHISERHAPLSRESYAAQFSPFAALTGYDLIVRETARLTNARPELDEYRMEDIRRRLCFLRDIEHEAPPLTVTFFRADERKSGGETVTLTGTLKKIDDPARSLILREGDIIPMDDIVDIVSPLIKDE